MPLYKEQGIVLRTMRLGEADRIVTVLTQGTGKIRAVAKGIRKTRSKFGASSSSDSVGTSAVTVADRGMSMTTPISPTTAPASRSPPAR